MHAQEPFLRGAALFFSWTDLPPASAGLVAVEEGVTAAQLDRLLHSSESSTSSDPAALHDCDDDGEDGGGGSTYLVVGGGRGGREDGDASGSLGAALATPSQARERGGGGGGGGGAASRGLPEVDGEGAVAAGGDDSTTSGVFPSATAGMVGAAGSASGDSRSTGPRRSWQFFSAASMSSYATALGGGGSRASSGRPEITAGGGGRTRSGKAAAEEEAAAERRRAALGRRRASDVQDGASGRRGAPPRSSSSRAVAAAAAAAGSDGGPSRHSVDQLRAASPPLPAALGGGASALLRQLPTISSLQRARAGSEGGDSDGAAAPGGEAPEAQAEVEVEVGRTPVQRVRKGSSLAAQSPRLYRGSAAAAGGGGGQSPVLRLTSAQVSEQIEVLKDGLLGRGESVAVPAVFTSIPPSQSRRHDQLLAAQGAGGARSANGSSESRAKRAAVPVEASVSRALRRRCRAGPARDRLPLPTCRRAWARDPPGATALVFKCRWPCRFGPHALLALKVLRDPFEGEHSEHMAAFAYEAYVLEALRWVPGRWSDAVGAWVCVAWTCFRGAQLGLHRSRHWMLRRPVRLGMPRAQQRSPLHALPTSLPKATAACVSAPSAASQQPPTAISRSTLSARVFAPRPRPTGRACRHPNVVRIYGYCLEAPTVCLVMELLPSSLKQRLRGGAGLSEPASQQALAMHYTPAGTPAGASAGAPGHSHSNSNVTGAAAAAAAAGGSSGGGGGGDAPPTAPATPLLQQAAAAAAAAATDSARSSASISRPLAAVPAAAAGATVGAVQAEESEEEAGRSSALTAVDGHVTLSVRLDPFAAAAVGGAAASSSGGGGGGAAAASESGSSKPAATSDGGFVRRSKPPPPSPWELAGTPPQSASGAMTSAPATALAAAGEGATEVAAAAEAAGGVPDSSESAVGLSVRGVSGVVVCMFCQAMRWRR